MEHIPLLHSPTVDNLSDNEDLETDEPADSKSVADKNRKADYQVVDQAVLHQPEKLLKTIEFKCKFCSKLFSKNYDTEHHIQGIHG